MDKELRRRRWIINRKLEDRRSTEIATALRIDERTVYRWWRVYRKHGWAGLHVKSHRPHMIHRTSQATVDLILQLRRARNWGPCRIEGYLHNYNRQSRVGHTTIHKILNQAGVNNPIPKPRMIWSACITRCSRLETPHRQITEGLGSIRFVPKGKQSGLVPVQIVGGSVLNPDEEQILKLRQLRKDLQKERDQHPNDSQEHRRLDTTQNELKSIANTTVYGIFIQVDTEHTKCEADGVLLRLRCCLA